MMLLSFRKIAERYKLRLRHQIYMFRFGQIENEVRDGALSFHEANALLWRALIGSKPFLAGRMGGYEARICWRHERGRKITKNLKRQVLQNAGISSAGDKDLSNFAAIYKGAVPYLDLAGLWGEPNSRGMIPLLHKFGPKTLLTTEFQGVEPWHVYVRGETPWTQALAGQSVLVVYPFAETIRKQYKARRNISGVRDVLPDFELQTLTPPVTFAGVSNSLTWLENLRRLMEETARRRFDVALIGCGAYGLPLGAFVKQMGRKAVHMGGSTQLLFGIRGARWDAWEPYASIIGAGWVRPTISERPRLADAVENGCYW